MTITQDTCGIMRKIVADLHLHTCLSPCAELDMSPRRLIRKAVSMGIDMIAVTDHNSAENVEAAMKVAEKEGICVLPGMEISSSEEVHVLAIFDTAEKAHEMQDVVYGNLPSINKSGRDWQVVVNEDDEVMGFNGRLLIGATRLHLKNLVAEIHRVGGLAIASHVDRGSFSIRSQLVFVPVDVGFDAFEVINRDAAEPALIFHPGVPRIRSSDSHRLEDIGSRTTTFYMKEPSYSELALTLGGEEGRHVLD